MAGEQRQSGAFRADRSIPQQIVLWDGEEWVATCSPRYADILADARLFRTQRDDWQRSAEEWKDKYYEARADADKRNSQP